MKSTRVLWELGLAAGAIAGVLFITTSVSPSSRRQFPNGVPSLQIAGANQRALKESPSLSQLIGVAQFVKHPTRYKIAYGDKPVEVTGAILEGDRMEIAYRYEEGRKAHAGKLTGTINSRGVFSGTYRSEQTEAIQAQATEDFHQGDITLTFEPDGTAQGSQAADNVTTRILLKG
ncbi:MAG: hypothetical protein AAFU53_10980 [Cyanobacteria bacterium J06632_3]